MIPVCCKAVISSEKFDETASQLSVHIPWAYSVSHQLSVIDTRNQLTNYRWSKNGAYSSKHVRLLKILHKG